MGPTSAIPSSRISFMTRERMVPFVLFLFALIVRLLIIDVAHFDGLYGQDAFAYLDYAKQILALHLVGPFYWPFGYPAMAALFTLLFHDPVVGAQAANIILGALLAPLMYLISGDVLDMQAHDHSFSLKLIAGLIAALSGQLLHSSIVIMSDVSSVFWATLSAYALIRLNRSDEWFWLPLSAFALALAMVTRWLYAVLILPFGLYFLIVHCSLIRSSRFVSAVLISLFIVIPQFIFSQSSAQPVLSHGWVVNWNPLHAFQSSFDNPDGHFDYRWPPALFYAEPLFHPYYLFPLLAPFVFLGVWRLYRSPMLILIGGWILTLYLYLVGIPYENFRFGLAFFPPIIILMALGLALGAPSFHRLKWLFILFNLLASIPFVYRGLTSLFDLKADELASASYLQKWLPPSSTVVTFSLTLTLEHYTDFKSVELFDQSPCTLHDLICSSNGPIYLFIQTRNLETQWTGRGPQVNYHWLRDQVGLQDLGNRNGWMLYAISHRCVDFP